MNFNGMIETAKLQGKNAPIIRSLPNHTISKIAQGNFIIIICMQLHEIKLTPQLHYEMVKLLEGYNNLFAEPLQLLIL